MRTSSALRHIEHIASLSLAPHIAIPEMLRALNAVVPGANSEFFWVGASGEVLDTYASMSPRGAGGPPHRSDPQHREHAPCARSALLHFEPDGGFHLTVTLRGKRRAVLTMQRGGRATPFTERERRMLVALAPSFGRALESLPGECGDLDDLADRIGVIVATQNGRLLSADSLARQLLIELIDQPLTPDALRKMQENLLPPFLTDFLRSQGARSPAPSALQRTSRWGAYRIRAFPQHQSGGDPAPCAAPPSYALILSHHLPRTVRTLRAVERFDLSPRERQAAFQLGIGADAASGAAALNVSVATWRSYVKRVYQRLEVNDRVGLMNRLHDASLG